MLECDLKTAGILQVCNNMHTVGTALLVAWYRIWVLHHISYHILLVLPHNITLHEPISQCDDGNIRI